jgi:hypothetical protein
MEPVSYMVGLSWSVAGYSFFLYNKTDFSERGLRDVIRNDIREIMIDRERLNVQRAQILHKRIRQLKDFMHEIRHVH